MAERVRSPVFRKGVFFPDGATVQPARLVRALRRAAIGAGVQLHERSPALRIRDGQVSTSGGSVRAPEIVVAVNAAATGWRPVSRHVTNFGSYVVLTEPVPELLKEIGWTGGEAILDARMFLHYFRTTNDGRVLMGSGSGPIGFRGRVDARFTEDVATAARAEQGLRRLLPGLADARIERAWGGPIDVSADHLPFFGTVKGKRIHYGLGYSGHGVGPTWLGGQILASLVLRTDDEWTASPLASRRVASLPPEPLKHFGGALVRSAILASRVRGRRRPPRASARKSRRRSAEAVRNGDRDALAGRSLVAALDRSGAAPVLGLADDLRGLAALAGQIGRALQLAAVARVPRAVVTGRGGDRTATACQAGVSQNAAVLERHHDGDDEDRGDEHSSHPFCIGIRGICLNGSDQWRLPPSSWWARKKFSEPAVAIAALAEISSARVAAATICAKR